MDKFNSLISNQNWTSVTNDEDTQSAFTNFHSIFMTDYKNSFPFKPIPAPYKSKLPWLSQGLKKAIAIKKRLYRKQLKLHTPANITSYKIYRNKLTHLLRTAERNHYQSLLELNKSNLRKSWADINTISMTYQTFLILCLRYYLLTIQICLPLVLTSSHYKLLLI